MAVPSSESLFVGEIQNLVSWGPGYRYLRRLGSWRSDYRYERRPVQRVGK